MAEEAEGIRVGTASRSRSKTKDRNAESFWDLFGRNKTSLSLHKTPSGVSEKSPKHVLSSHDLHVAERRVQQHLGKFFFDEKEEKLFVKSTELSMCHQIY